MELRLTNLGYTANFSLQSLIHSACSALLFKGLMNQCKSKGCVPEGTTHNATSCLNTTAFCWLCWEFVRSQQDLDLLIWLTELRAAPFEAWGQNAAAQDTKVAVQTQQNCSHHFPARHLFVLVTLIKWNAGLTQNLTCAHLKKAS